MAFTGTPVITQVSDRIVRITGVSLAGAASGTIGLFGATGTAPGVKLPEQFLVEPYTYHGTPVGLSDMLDVSAKADATDGITVAVPIVVTKSGTTQPTWRATITNPSASVSTGLEIYVKLHD